MKMIKMMMMMVRMMMKKRMMRMMRRMVKSMMRMMTKFSLKTRRTIGSSRHPSSMRIPHLLLLDIVLSHRTWHHYYDEHEYDIEDDDY